MMINRNNYEAFFLDYIEGRLNEEQRAEVQLFLLANPDLAAEIEDLDVLPPSDQTQTNDDRLNLYRSLHPGEAPIYPPVTYSKPENPRIPVFLPKLHAPAIVFIGKHALYHQNNALSWNLLPGWGIRLSKPIDKQHLTILKADGVLPRLTAPAIVFENKTSLYKSVVPVVPMAPATEGAKVISLRRSLYYGAAAAAIAALIWVGVSDNETNVVANRAVESPYEQKTTKENTPVTNDKTDKIDSTNNSSPGMNPERDIRKQRPIYEQELSSSIDVAVEQSPKKHIGSEVENMPEQPIQIEIINPTLPSQEEGGIAQENSLPVNELPIVNINEEQNALFITAASNNKNYTSIWEYAKDRAKSKMWGSENYPKQDYTFSLVKKELEKSESIEIDASPSKKKGRFHLRIGKFAFTQE